MKKESFLKVILVKKRVHGECYLKRKLKAFLFVAELNKMLFVISETCPRCGLTVPLQSELCVHEHRAHSDQPGSHPASTQQCQDHFSPVTACL